MYFSSELAAAYIATDQLELTCMQQRRQCSRLKEYGQGLEYKSHFRGQNSTITQQTNKQSSLPCCWARWLRSKERSSEGVLCIFSHSRPQPISLSRETTFPWFDIRKLLLFWFSSFARKQHRFIWSPVPLVYPILSSKRQIAVHIFAISDIWLENDLRNKRKKKNSFVENG